MGSRVELVYVCAISGGGMDEKETVGENVCKSMGDL